MALEETVMDERGRVTIGKKTAGKFGRRFFVVRLPNEIVLIPKPKNPIKELQEWGKMAKIKHLSAEEINKISEGQAWKEIKERMKRRRQNR